MGDEGSAVKVIPVTVFWQISVFVSVFMKDGEEEGRREEGERRRVEGGGRKSILNC